jgi:hypothetical protein
MTKTERVLAEMKRRGGMTFTQIQEFVVTMNGLDWNTRDGYGRRRYRGYWCDYLLGNTDPRGPGMLPKYCRKCKDGKYRVRAKPRFNLEWGTKA